MKKRHGRRGRIACFNNTACEQRVICVWMKITTRHSIPSQMPMQMIQWWTSADVHYPFYPSYFFFSDFPWRNSFLAFSSSVIFFFPFFFFFSHRWIVCVEKSTHSICHDTWKSCSPTIVIYFTTDDIWNVCWICLFCLILIYEN